MEINGEPVRLVEKFSDLRTGMPVYILCRWPKCVKPHRGMLGDSYVAASILHSNGAVSVNAPVITVLPTPKYHDGNFVVSADAVGLQLVYAIIDERFEAEQAAQCILKPKQIRKVASNVK